MAKKPVTTDELPPAMDYAQHNATYAGFMMMVKWGIVAMLFIVLALYSFIQLHNGWLGTALLFIMLLVIGGRVVMGGGRRTA